MRAWSSPPKHHMGAPVLFLKKQGGSLRMCVDYKALNKITIKNKYSIPLAAELFDRLSKIEYFTKLDLRFGCKQVRVAKGGQGQDYMCDAVWKLRVLNHALRID